MTNKASNEMHELLEAIKPFAEAFERTLHYGEPKSDYSPMFIEEGNTFFELLHDNEEERLNLGNLSKLYTIYKTLRSNNG